MNDKGELFFQDDDGSPSHGARRDPWTGWCRIGLQKTLVEVMGICYIALGGPAATARPFGV